MTYYSDYIGKQVHLIGVGGSSMSGLALLLKERGCIVSGSDRSESENITSLKAAGIDVMIGHCAGNVEDKDLIIHSMAIDPDNIESKKALDGLNGLVIEDDSIININLIHLSQNDVSAFTKLHVVRNEYMGTWIQKHLKLLEK